MKGKKIKHGSLSRQDISNPRHNIKHSDNLKEAGIKTFEDGYQIINLPNDKIVVRAAKKV